MIPPHMSVTGAQVGLLCQSPLYHATVNGIPSCMSEQPDFAPHAHVQFKVNEFGVVAFAFIKDKSWEIPATHIFVKIQGYNAGESICVSSRPAEKFKIFGKIIEKAFQLDCKVDFNTFGDEEKPHLSIEGPIQYL